MSRYYCTICEIPHEEGQGQCPKEHEYDLIHPQKAGYMSRTWTREKPVEIGWYWYQAAPHLLPIVIWVTADGYAEFCGSDLTSEIKTMPGQWIGPVEPEEQS